jgi:hypothetical protein
MRSHAASANIAIKRVPVFRIVIIPFASWRR